MSTLQWGGGSLSLESCGAGGKKDYFLLKLLMDDSQDNQSTFLDFQLAMYSLVNTVNLGNTV